MTASPAYHSRLMSDGLPAFVDPLRLADAGRSIAGRLPVHRFRRLAEVLAEVSGEVEVALTFERETPARAIVVGSVRADLWLVCQRCLEPVAVTLDLPVRLTVVRSEAEAERLDEGDEPLIVEEQPIPLVELVEDEILLALPQVPMHPWSVCGQRVEAARLRRETELPTSPFAALEALRGRRNQREEP